MTAHRFVVTDPPTLEELIIRLNEITLRRAQGEDIPLEVEATTEGDDLADRRKDTPKTQTLCFRPFELDYRPWKLTAQRADTNTWAYFTYDTERHLVTINEVS